MTSGEFPSEPITVLEQLAVMVEAVQPEVLATLGQISYKGASQESLNWVGLLSDVSDRISLALDQINEGINETPTDIEPPTITTANEQADAPDMSERTKLVLEFFLKNSAVRVEEIRQASPELASLTAKEFSTIRKQVVTALSGHDIAATWLSKGKTRGTRYTLTIDNPDVDIIRILFPAEQLEMSVSDMVVPQGAVPAQNGHANTVVAEWHDDTQPNALNPESIETFITTHPYFSIRDLIHLVYGVDFVEKSLFTIVVTQLTQLAEESKITYSSKGLYRSLVYQAPALDGQGHEGAPSLIDQQVLADYIKENPRFTMTRLIQDLFDGTRHLPKADYDNLRSQLESLREEGKLVLHGNMYSYQAPSSNIDAMLKGVASPYKGGRKPKNRGRWRHNRK